MDKDELELRTKQFALKTVKFVASLPGNRITDVLGVQLLKAGTSIGANYREANRAESRKDFAHKIGIVQKEAAECQYWIELFQETDTPEKQPNRRSAQRQIKSPTLLAPLRIN